MQDHSQDPLQKSKKNRLRRGFTTGSCAAVAAKAALLTLLRGHAPHKTEPWKVEIALPRGERPTFSIFRAGFLKRGAYAVVRKDAGDDPDVTHRALVMVALEIVTLEPQNSKAEDSKAEDSKTEDSNAEEGEENSKGEVSVEFRAGRGVGVVTMAGLPLPVGEPAINHVPRRMIVETLTAALEESDLAEAEREGDDGGGVKKVGRRFVVTIGVADGVRLAEQTWNGRLGIVGGLSILGTTGIVEPYSCSAWIHAIHRGIDVARAAGTPALAAATGRTSEGVVRALLGLAERDVIDMGDFASGMLKYMRKNPVACLTIAGGVGKMVKLAQGHGDLHSGRSQVDFSALGRLARECGFDEEMEQNIASCVSVGAVLSLLGGEDEIRGRLLCAVAEGARGIARKLLLPQSFPLGIVLIDRGGRILTHLEAE